MTTAQDPSLHNSWGPNNLQSGFCIPSTNLCSKQLNSRFSLILHALFLSKSPISSSTYLAHTSIRPNMAIANLLSLLTLNLETSGTPKPELGSCLEPTVETLMPAHADHALPANSQHWAWSGAPQHQLCWGRESFDRVALRKRRLKIIAHTVVSVYDFTTDQNRHVVHLMNLMIEILQEEGSSSLSSGRAQLPPQEIAHKAESCYSKLLLQNMRFV